MDFVKSIDILGVKAKEIPCITGKSKPTVATKGAVGCLYMDESTGYIYKCTAVSGGVYTWISTDKSFAELQEEFTLAQAQINELVAMRGSEGEMNFVHKATDVEFNLRSNGVYAAITGRIISATIATGSTLEVDIPDKFKPFVGGVLLLENNSVIIRVSVKDVSPHNAYLEVYNKTSSNVTVPETYFEGHYATNEIFIAELANIRIGDAPEPFETAGDAVRDLFRQAMDTAQRAEADISNALGPYDSLAEAIRIPIFDLSESSDIVPIAKGNIITLNDSSNRKLQGLKIYGHYKEESGVVGDKGSVTVNVSGKNILNVLDTKISNGTVLETGEDYVIAQGIDGSSDKGSSSWGNGVFYYNETNRIPCKNGVSYTVSIDFTFLEDPYASLPNSNITRFPQINASGDATKTSSVSWLRPAVGVKRRITATFLASKDGSFYFYIPLMAAKVKLENPMVEIGTTATAYEPYKEPQTLTIPTDIGWSESGDKIDEIDFAKGVSIHRVGFNEPVVIPLPTAVLAEYAKLHTYKPTTIITNDYGAEMAVEYMADTKTYIDNKFVELASIIANNT